MTGDLEKQRKRLRFQCWHRGTKELDLLLGGFAEERLASLSADQLDRLEVLLEVPEPLLYAWVVGRTQPASDYDHDVMSMLKNFKLKR